MKLHHLTTSPHLQRRGFRFRVLTVDETLACTPDELQRLRAAGVFPALAGGDDGDGDDGDGDGGDGTGDGDDDDGDGAGGSDDDGDDDGDDSEAAKAKAEAARQRRRANDAEKENRRLKREAEKQKREAQEADGEYKELYETEVAAHAKTREKVADKAKEATIMSVATRLNFRDPDLAVDLVKVKTEDVVDDDFEVDEKPIERALKDLAKKRTYLVKDERNQNGDAGEGERDERRRRDREDDERDDDLGRDGESPRPRERLRRYHEEQERKTRAAA